VKYVLLVPDGMSDRPQKSLGGRTPLGVARTPNMDSIAAEGITGTASTVPESMSSGTAVAMLAVMGYDPTKYRIGRGPVEAASMGIQLAEGDVAFRCNLVTAVDGVMVDSSAGHISTQEAHVLIDAIAADLSAPGVAFVPGVSYRHLVIFSKGGAADADALLAVRCTPPHDIVGEKTADYWPSGGAADAVGDLMERSQGALSGHEVNTVRRDLGEREASMIWLWGQGARADLPRFFDRWGVQGAVISAVDVVNGFAALAGMKVIHVEGATGYFDTNYEGKAAAAVDALSEVDFVLVHVEATDEAGHIGDAKLKVRAIEDFDARVVGPVLEGVRKYAEHRVLVVPDHATVIGERSPHAHDPVPFAMCGWGIKPDGSAAYTEEEAQGGSVRLRRGYKLMERFIRREAASGKKLF